jgi:hypothetical protein
MKGVIGRASEAQTLGGSEAVADIVSSVRIDAPNVRHA